MKWDKTVNRVDIFLASNIEGISIVTSKNTPLCKEIVSDLNVFLNNEGIRVINYESNNTNLIIDIEILENEKHLDPVIFIEHTEIIEEFFKNFLFKELNQLKLPFRLYEIKNTYENRLNFKFCLSSRKITENEISLFLSKAILCYVNKQHKNLSNYYIPKILIKQWIKILMNNAVVLDIEKEASTIEQIEDAPVLTKNRKLSIKEETKAEVFFDYTLLPPRSEEKNSDLLIKGNLYIKNTGTTELINPIICIKMPSNQNISLQGQILPPKMISSALITNEGLQKGWKYAHNDWREKVKHKGEYWITPIQELIISPGQNATFSGFNLTIQEMEKTSFCIVSAFVYFNNGKLKYTSNNSITCSF
ncbi:MAG: hypothetical protein QM671_27790 [Bacillus sp. (in: firmicutes)]